MDEILPFRLSDGMRRAEIVFQMFPRRVKKRNAAGSPGAGAERDRRELITEIVFLSRLHARKPAVIDFGNSVRLR